MKGYVAADRKAAKAGVPAGGGERTCIDLLTVDTTFCFHTAQSRVHGSSHGHATAIYSVSLPEHISWHLQGKASNV